MEYTQPKPKAGNTAIFLRLPPNVSKSLDTLVEHYASRRGIVTKSDVVRELILEAARKLARTGATPTDDAA